MSSRTKLFAKLADAQRDSTWTLAELEKLLGWSGWSLTGGRGSHRVFTHPTAPMAITLAAHGNSIKAGYVRNVRETLADLPPQS